MSDAIRCENCRWWERDEDEEYRGYCQLNPPVYIGGDPADFCNWFQPPTFQKDGCSRGEPKTEPPTTGDE